MTDDREFTGKLAIGLFVEGQYLHAACLAVHKKRVKLIDAQIVKMQKSMENVKVEEEVLSEVFTDSQEDMAPLDISDDIANVHWDDTDTTSDARDNAEILRTLLKKYPNKKNKLAISLAEPQIYYSYYGSDWGLEGKKLTQKILEDLVRERQNGETIYPDALHVVKLKDGRLMGLVRDKEVNILNILDYLRSEKDVRIPKISLIESGETAIVNLVNANYDFDEEDITVIVYMGNEFSRLIFLKGNEIYNISYIIGAGLDSENITNTIFSRILLEQDNLNLPKIHNVLLTGEAFEVGLKGYLESKLSEEINVDYLRLNNLDVIGNEPLASRFAVAIGTAWRILNDSEEYFYDVNLLPMKIREGQKRFKLGLIGWTLLFLLPAISFYSTQKISQQIEALTQLKVSEQNYKTELAGLQEIEAKVNAQRARLSKYENAFKVLDAMSIGRNKWNDFLYKLDRVTSRTGNLWLTDMTSKSNEAVTLRGFSLFRNRIPQFSNAIGGGDLDKVLVQDIRDKRVYNFELEAKLPSE
ncbi:MAG: hypothetical protein P8184_03840 [Calditrichia bacterium]